MEANIHQNGFSQIIQSHNLALSNENKKGYLLASTRFGTYQSGGASVSSEGEMKISQMRGDDLINDIDQDVIDNIDSKVKEWQSKSSYDGNYFEWKAKK